MYVPIGSRLTYVADYTSTLLAELFSPPADCLSAVNSDLKNSNNILVEGSNIDDSVFSPKVTFTLQLKTNDGDHASEDDIKSIVDHYFYVEAGMFPNSSRVTNVTVPGGISQNTGAPPAPPDNPNNTNDATTPISSWLSSVFGSLGAGTTGAALGIVAGVALVIGVGLFIAARE